MDALMLRYGLSLLLFTSIASSTESNGTNEETREPRVNGRIVKLYSGVKPNPYVCTGEGFQGDPTNCAVFYRCVKEKSGKFTVFRYQCAPGTVYDSDLETCNHPRNTRRAECGGMKPTTETFHIANNNEIDGAQSEIPRPISTKVPMYTEHTTLKNPTLSWILSTERQNIRTKAPWVSNIHSTLSQSSSTSEYYWPSTQFQTEIGQSSKTTFAPENTQQSKTKNNEPCTSAGFMGDSENCRKFYRCVGNQRGGYIKYEFSCSESTIWDDEIQGCNHPWNVKRSKCGRSLSYEDKSIENFGLVSNQSSSVKESVANNGEYGQKSNKTIQQQLQISHGTKVTQTQTQISNNPEIIQNQTQINYGDKVKKNKNVASEQNQTQVSRGTAVSQTQTQIDYGNKGVQTQLQIDHSKDSSQSQVQIHDSITDQPTSTTTIKNNSEKNECSESGFMGDTNDCKKFYRCVDNGRGKYNRFEYFCGDGTVWDPEIEACNHAWAVKNCGGKMSPAPTTEKQIASTTKSSAYQINPTKTAQSYSTSSQNPDVEDEDDIGYGNQNQETTQLSSTTTFKTTTSSMKPTTTTEKPDGANTECTSSGFVGDSNNCKIFYRCVDNGHGGYTKHEFKCGDGTLWDSSIEACNHAWAVKNCGLSTSENVNNEKTTTKENTIITTTTPLPSIVSTTVTLVQITTQASTQIDDYDTGYGSQNQDLSTTTTTTTKPAQQEQSDNSDYCKASGFMGDKNDCKKFYRCVDNGNGGYIRYEFTCGEGTVWDPKIEACNHVWAVENCGANGTNGNAIESTETSSQSTHSTSSSDTSSVDTTHFTEQTDKPTSITMTTTTSKSSSSTSSSSASNKCSSSGFMGDSTDCKKFYRCVDNGDGSYTRYEFTCGEGTVWDPKIEACNHAWAVEKCGGSSESTHLLEQTTSQQSVMQDEEQEHEYVTPSYEASEITSSTSSSSTTSTTSSATGQCNESGFMGDKNDCKKFYRCVDNGRGGYDRYEFQCGEGTAWDSSIEACNHASAVKDCGGSISVTTHFQNESTTQLIPSSTTTGQTQQTTEKSTTSTIAHQESDTGNDQCKQEGFFGSKIECKRFYRCVDNGNGGYTKYEFTCGEGTSWNQEIQSCDHISPDRPCSNTSQVSTSSEPVYLNDDMDIQTTSTTESTSSTKEIGNESTQTTNKPLEAQDICSSEGFYADSSDCKKFYRCVANGNGGYIKYSFNCGDGTVWNQEIQACDHESADKKCSGTSTSATNTTEFQSESTTSSYSTTKKQDTTDKFNSTESIASEHCTSEGFFAYPNDCKKFIRCVDNGNGGFTRYEFSCGDGTVWVQEIQACDHDNDVTSCSSQSGLATTSKPQNTEEHSYTTTAAPSTENITPNKENDEYDNGNLNEPSHDEMDGCTSEGYFANSQDCRKFYRCVDNGNGGYTKYDFVCGDGTAWDSNLQTCNHINEVQSCSGSTQENTENHETTTNKNQAATESSSSTTKATTTSDSSSGSSSTTSNGKDTCESEGYFGNTKDCKKFYRCVDNGKGGFTKYDFTCGDGTIWDQDITSCNHPQDVSNPSCGSNHETSDSSSTTTSTTGSSSQTSSSTTESSTATESSQSTSGCSQESSKQPTNDTVTCEKAGYYANPNDCKKFYRCVDWDGDGKKFSVFHFECGEGTIWDPALDTCNHEDSVYPRRDCTQTQSQNVGGETTTTTTESTTNAQTTDEYTSTTSQSSETTTTEPTTNEPTTTQQPATTEQTTTQQSTSEQTTTQQTTTSRAPTTTEQSTTSEQTTTEQSTTSEQTTTQQSTISEPTTHQSTTSEQTTTQQSTTSEQTTTQQSTTSEQTTTQQPTTSEQTTTQQSTTSEQTTTQQSTTSEKTTTPQSGTTEQTTTEQSTSEQTTTQQSTTEQTTTQQSTTTDQTTTQQPTTTTDQSTSEQTTTQQSTTSEQTTIQQSTTVQTTTTDQTTTQDSSTTDQTSTQESSTTEQTTTEQTTERFTTTQETTDQSTTQSSSTESDSTVDQSTTESSTTESTSSSEKECPETDDDQYLLVCPTSFRRHPKYCNMFYQCTEDEETYEAKMAMFKCPNNTIYDESQTQCVTEDKADKKCNGEMVNKRRFKRLGPNYKEPIVADKGKQSCSTTGYFSFEKKSECSKGFLKCERSKNGKLSGLVYQCPDGYIYWSISKRCERVENVKDCKRSINDWTGRWNIPVERKNISTR